MNNRARIKTSFASASAALLAATMILVGSGEARAEAIVGVEVSRIGDATHIEFKGVSDWKYDFKRDGKEGSSSANRAVLRLANLKPEAVTKLKSLSDSLIKSVQINEKGVDGSAEVTFELAPNSDFFDYISDQPSRLVVDFFPKEGPKEAPAEAVKPAKAVPKLPAKVASESKQEREPASDEDDEEDEDDEDTIVVQKKLPAKKTKRNPAGTDGLLVNEVTSIAKGKLPEGPTLAEQISSKKDFTHGIFDGGDPEFRRFSIKDYEIKEDAIIASRANYYLPFPMLDLGVPQLKSLVSVAPTYEIVPADTQENKDARVLHRLFTSGERALFLKTAAEFLQTYPKSNYDEIVRYMVADAHYDIYRAGNSIPDFETAMGLYLSLSEKYPESPLAPRTLLLMGYSYLDRGDSFGALKAFQRFSRLHPESKHIDRVNISIAEAYLKLNRFDDAYLLLDELEKGAKTEKGRQEAAFRKGDVFFRKKDFVKAIEQYRGAIARHPAAASRFANAYYNISESEFVLGRYRESLDSYRNFLQKFPDHEHGGYAMTRMGELLNILGADPKRAEGAFMEANFRYRATPGAGIARIRLLASRMSEMKEKELGSALTEIDEIVEKYSTRPPKKKEAAPVAAAAPNAAKDEAKAKEGDAKAAGHGPAAESEETALRLIPKEGEDATKRRPELPGIEEFTTLLIADAYKDRREYDTAVKNLISYYQKNPQSANKEKFRTRIVANMADGIRSAVDKGDFIDGLRRYSKNASGWLKNSDRVDLRFNVGRAYEQAGVYKEAAAIYAESLKRLNALKGSKEEREHHVFENMPTVETVNLRQAAVAAKDKEFASAESHLKKIQNLGALSQKEQIERAEIAAEVAEARGQADIARKYLTELIAAWKGEPELTSPLHLRIAKLQAAKRNYQDADAHLAKIIDWKKEEGSGVSDDLHAQALEMRADLLVTRGKRNEAIKGYRELLTQYESSRPLESVRYRLGQLLFQDGDLKGAEEVWGELRVAKNEAAGGAAAAGAAGANAPKKESLWQKLATEQMQSAKWQNEYKKYLNRIPAAAELRESKAQR